MKRGSAQLALSIARSDVRSAKAVQNFECMIFSENTSASKNSMFELWARVCRTRGWQPLPVTCESMMHVAAILKEAGFTSVANYSHEARDRHGRAGFSWTRASKRAIGHAKRSDEVCPEIWETLADSRGIDPECWDSAADAAAGGIALWMVGTLFLLREAIGTLQVRCPFHMMEKLVNLQLARLGFDSIEDVPIGAYTLVAQRRDPFGASV